VSDFAHGRRAIAQQIRQICTEPIAKTENREFYQPLVVSYELFDELSPQFARAKFFFLSGTPE
jgi:hypothetical protein